jgi:hypothetical protein
MIQQAFTQMSEISMGVASGRYALVNLNDVNSVPGHLLIGKRAQHDPGRIAAAKCRNEAAAFSNSVARFRGDETRSFARCFQDRQIL